MDRLNDLDPKVIDAISSSVAVYRTNTGTRPEATVLATGLLPDDTTSILGMDVLISPYIAPGTIMVTTLDSLREIREAIEGLDSQ